MKPHIHTLLNKFFEKPCEEAVEFAKQFDTIEEAIDACPRGDWLLWLADHLGVNLRKLTLAKGYCANTIYHLMNDERSRRAVDTAIMFGRYKATREELDNAADNAAAAYASYYAAASGAAAASACLDSYASAAAAYAYASAAYACLDSSASAAAAYASAAAAYASYAFASYDSQEENQQKTADICRKYLRDDLIKKFNKL